MKAGPELDALVAEKVMGWEIWRHPYGQIEIITEDETYEIEYFKPSKELMTAWKVVMKFKESRFLVRKGFINELQQEVTPEEIKASGSLLHESELIYYLTPLTICLAGLRAVGIEVDHD